MGKRWHLNESFLLEIKINGTQLEFMMNKKFSFEFYKKCV